MTRILGAEPGVLLQIGERTKGVRRRKSAARCITATLMQTPNILVGFALRRNPSTRCNLLPLIPRQRFFLILAILIRDDQSNYNRFAHNFFCMCRPYINLFLLLGDIPNADQLQLQFFAPTRRRNKVFVAPEQGQRRLVFISGEATDPFAGCADVRSERYSGVYSQDFAEY